MEEILKEADSRMKEKCQEQSLVRVRPCSSGFQDGWLTGWAEASDYYRKIVKEIIDGH